MATKKQATLQVLKGKPAQVDAFGANGKAPQTAYTVSAAAPAGGTGATAGAYDTAAHRDALIQLVNDMRAALIACGICV